MKAKDIQKTIDTYRLTGDQTVTHKLDAEIKAANKVSWFNSIESVIGLSREFDVTNAVAAQRIKFLRKSLLIGILALCLISLAGCFYLGYSFLVDFKIQIIPGALLLATAAGVHFGFKKTLELEVLEQLCSKDDDPDIFHPNDTYNQSKYRLLKDVRFNWNYLQGREHFEDVFSKQLDLVKSEDK